MEKGAPSIVLREELEVLRLSIIANHIQAGQKASGRTMRSLRVEVSEDGGTLWGRSPFGVLETGRKAGRVPQGFQQIIIQWMADKGIRPAPIPYLTNRPHKYTPEQRGVLRMSYFIARKIRQQGTRLFRQGGRSDIYSQEIRKTVERVQDRLLALIRTEIENIKLNGMEL